MEYAGNNETDTTTGKAERNDVAAWAGRTADAKQATAVEHELTFRKAIKLYPKAVG